MFTPFKKQVWLINLARQENPILADPNSPELKTLMEQIRDLPGCTNMDPHNDGIIWIFDSEENARAAKSKIPLLGATPAPKIGFGYLENNTLYIKGTKD